MSVEAIEWALNRAPDVSPALVVVLVGLANHADPAGRGAAPAQRRLAHYARKSERTVRRDLAELETLGLIRRGDQRRVAYLPADRRPVVWDLATDRARDVPVDLDTYAEPQSGRPAALPVGNPVENRGDAHVRPAAGVRSVDQPGGRTRPAGRPATTSADANRGDAYVRRTKGLEEETPPTEATALAVALLLDLPEPWRVGRRTAERLASAVDTALAAGWTTRDLSAHLAANPEGVKSFGAVLRTRLADLPRPRRRAKEPSRQRCPRHQGEWAANCGPCRSERIALP